MEAKHTDSIAVMKRATSTLLTYKLPLGGHKLKEGQTHELVGSSFVTCRKDPPLLLRVGFRELVEVTMETNPRAALYIKQHCTFKHVNKNFI